MRRSLPSPHVEATSGRDLTSWSASWLETSGVNTVVVESVEALDPVAAAIVGLLGVFNAVFQHANLNTPRWLAWLIQRPEAHSIHHAVHGWNYSDFPLWDIVFGSYRAAAGFERRGDLR